MLDYNCNKFGVKNAKDFEEKWNEYCKMREYEKKFRENTEMLNANNENLVIMLKELGVKDADIWISRCEAIVDSREMVEIRHELNQRRQRMCDKKKKVLKIINIVIITSYNLWLMFRREFDADTVHNW